MAKPRSTGERSGTDVHPRARAARPGARRSPPAWTFAVAAALVYLAIALFAYHQVLFAPSTSLPGCTCGDQVQEVWFLRWPLYAISHGHDPFFTTWMDYPHGVNLAINTTAPLLGVVSAPLQLTIGSLLTFDVLLVAALAGSALSMCLALRRWVRSWAACFAGGLLYGFSAFEVGQGIGHVFLVAAFVPPVVLVLLDEILVAQRHHPLRDGALLALLLVVQYYISPEVLAMTVVMAAAGVVILALAHPRRVGLHAGHVVLAFGVCAVLCAAALAYPVWMALRGPQHVVGAPHPVTQLAYYTGDLLGPVLPTSNQLLAPAAVKVHGDALVGHNPTENGMYLGIPLIVVLAAFGWAFRRTREILFFLAMAIVAFVLALGSRLTVDGHSTAVRLPFDVFVHVPLLQDILAVRFSLFEQLFAAAALAVGLDLLVGRAREASPGGRWRGAVAPAGAAVAGLLPLVPAFPYPAGVSNVTPFFTSAVVKSIPEGTPALVYPYPEVPDAEWSLAYQVVAGLRYRVFGGDAFIPGPTGMSVTRPSVLQPATVERIFAASYAPEEAAALPGATLGANGAVAVPPVDAATVRELQTFLSRYRVGAVLVDTQLGVAPGTVVSYVTRALGPPTASKDGVDAWLGVPRLLRAPTG